MATFNIEGINFRAATPQELTTNEWRAVQALEYDAFSASFPGRADQEIKHLTQMDEPEAFRLSRLDPANAIRQEKFFHKQSFARPKVIAASYDKQIIGYAYAADNVSGGLLARTIKMHGTARRYAWLREVVVNPEFRRRGIATVMSGLLLENFDSEQPVSAYTWDENMPGSLFVQSLGLQVISTGRRVYPFGREAVAASMSRWAGQNDNVQRKIMLKPRGSIVMAHARESLKCKIT